jgi:UDPglucose--hexose-1-phosphate uridylyltransferase
VFPFENRGEAIGVTLHHPHGQIYAYPYVTPRTLRLLDAIDRTAPDLFDRILAFEQNGPRVVLRGEHYGVRAIRARWPIELHVLPHRHVPDFAGLTDAERDELAPFYLRLLRGIDALYDTPTPYIAAWHQAPVHVGRDTVRLTLQLTSPRRGRQAQVPGRIRGGHGRLDRRRAPETAATRLREAVEGVTL